jgi:hypothetical protein
MTTPVTKAGPPQKEETATLRMAVSARVYEYLGWLSRNTMLGASENDVARYILTESLKAMRKENYSEAELTERKVPLLKPD